MGSRGRKVSLVGSPAQRLVSPMWRQVHTVRIATNVANMLTRSAVQLASKPRECRPLQACKPLQHQQWPRVGPRWAPCHSRAWNRPAFCEQVPVSARLYNLNECGAPKLCGGTMTPQRQRFGPESSRLSTPTSPLLKVWHDCGHTSGR